MSQQNVIIYHANMQAALDLAAQGIPVFPFYLAPNPKHGKGPIKRPCIADWQNRATTDAAQIRRWWVKRPEAMPGIPTGPRTGFAVLDLDQKNGKDGFAALRALGHDLETLSSVIVESPGGSRHYYFRWPEGMGNSAAGLPPGMDVRAEGGYVAAPGAAHAGGSYRVVCGSLTDDLPPWPEALKPRLKAKETGQGEPTGLPFNVMRAALMALPNDGDTYGSRDAWLGIGMALHAETEGGEDGREAWHDWSRQWPSYDESATDAAWDSFNADGGVTGWAIIYEAERHGWNDATVTHLRYLADFDFAFTEDELHDIEIAALVGEPIESKPKVKLGTMTLSSDFAGSPMMQGDKLIMNQHNATLILGRNVESILPGLRHNLMTHRDEWLGGDVIDATIVMARMALELHGMKTVGKELVSDAALTVAKLRQYHPIRNDLSALRHDGKARLDSFLVRLTGADNTPYTRAVGRKFLIQMVARVMQPGCKADDTLVLIGPQGAGKSALCRLMAGAAYFSDTLPAITGGKDVMEHLQGVWLAELAELAPSRKSEAEDLKAFLTGTVDRFRVAYGKRTESFPRQNVFVGTTNDEEFLRDATGGRRFWPIKVGKINLEAFAAERDQLFAEAVAAYCAGESWWMDAGFEAEHARPMQDAARVVDSWADDVAAWLRKPASDFDGPGEVRAEVTVSEVMAEGLGLSAAQQGAATQKRVADVLKGLGWSKTHTKRGNVWKRAEVNRGEP